MSNTATRHVLAGSAEHRVGSTATAHSWRMPVLLFFTSMPIPFFFWFGSMQLTPARILLLSLTIPCVFIWLRGGAGRIRVADIAVLLMWFWTTLSFYVVEGPLVAIEAGGIEFVEAVGAYLIARCFIRNADDFRSMVRILFWVIMVMLLPAIYETLTANNIVLDIAKKIWSSAAFRDVPKEPRWGLDRVAGAFAHPILFGVFCGSSIALVYYVLGYGVSWTARWMRTFAVSLTTFLSLSSGPITALMVQLMLIGWDVALRSFRNRWVVLSSGFFLIYLTLELAAGRSVPQLYIDYFAFDRWTAGNRIRIWYYGTQNVADHPWFGVAFGDWERPKWMSPSMDMFWLVKAVRYGLPTAIFTVLALLSLVLGAAFKRGLNARESSYRTGYIICMVGFFMAGWTVNYWKDIYVLYMFMLGSGAWILEAGGSPGGAGAPLPEKKAGPPPRVIRYSRPRELLGVDKVRHVNF